MAGSRRKPGVLGPHITGFGGYLQGLGYTPGTVRGQLKVVGRLGRWLQARDLVVADLTAALVDEFLAQTGGQGRSRRAADRPTARRLLGYLVQRGAVPASSPQARSALEVLLADYRHWMVHDRGLADATVLRYENAARRFLQQRADRQDGPAAGLTGVEVSAFLLAESARCSVGAAKGRVAELRSLLRFLFITGTTPAPLAAAVPPVAGWHDTGIPATVRADDVAALLASCDRGTPVGIRDFAIITVVARLGLRSIEVARMRLDDVNWRTGEIIVRGKARRLDTMPLPVEVGDALADYLVAARGEPDVSQRELFLTVRAPRGPIRADLVGDVVERACRRAGIPRVGPHRLRHALARQMLAAGVPLTDISQVLRHRDLATTAIYAKVDLASLRMVARPWPGCPQATPEVSR